MNKIFSVLVLLGFCTGCSNPVEESKFRYLPYSSYTEYGDEKKSEDLDVSEEDVNDIVGIEYVKGAIKFKTGDDPEKILVREGESDLYKKDEGAGKMEIYAPKGADTINLNVTATHNGESALIRVNLKKIK